MHTLSTGFHISKCCHLFMVANSPLFQMDFQSGFRLPFSLFMRLILP
jgi:hypothetical protein